MVLCILVKVCMYGSWVVNLEERKVRVAREVVLLYDSKAEF